MQANSQEFFAALDNTIDSHEACDNAFFRLGRARTWSIAQLATFGPDYLFWVRSFPRILAGLVAHVHDEESRLFLTDILFSELGSGVSEKMHFKLFASILLSLGVSDEAVRSAPRYDETRCLVSGMESLYRHEEVAIALGAQYALEKQAFPMIEQLYQGFRRCVSKEQASYEYFDLHLVEEPRHLECMRRCVLGHVGSVDDQSKVTEGAKQCLDLIAKFWQRLFCEVAALQ